MHQSSTTSLEAFRKLDASGQYAAILSADIAAELKME